MREKSKRLLIFSIRRLEHFLAMREKSKRLLIFASKLGYQTRSFDEAAKKLGVALTFVTDRCHHGGTSLPDRGEYCADGAVNRAAAERIRVDDLTSNESPRCWRCSTSMRPSIDTGDSAST